MIRKNAPSGNRGSRKTLIQSVERALDILEIVGQEAAPVRSGEIAARLGVSPATASNLIRTLYMRGYLDQHRGGRYTLGLQTFILGSVTDIWRELRTASLELLRQLSRAGGATCFLGVLHQHQVIAVNVVESDAPINISIPQRWLDQYHSTAAGKVLLSALSETELNDFLAQYPLRRLTERTICDMQQLKAELAEVRRQGYSVVRDESVFGVSSLGVPVRGRDGRTIAALSAAFSSYFLNDDYRDRQLALLQETGQALEKRLFG